MAISILYVNGGPMNRGGIETFMMNYLRHMDLNQIHIDFAVRGPERGTYDDELESLGCKIYRLPQRSNENLIKTYKEDVAVKVKNGLEKRNSIVRKIKMMLFIIKQRVH